MSPAALDTVGLLEQRALEFALASRLVGCPDASMPAAVEDFAHARLEWVPAVSEARAQISGPAGLVELQSDYLRLFGSSKQRTSLNETEYGRMRGMAKGNDLADIAGFYRAFGLAVTEAADARDMPDHLAMELEFYAVLLARQAMLDESGEHDGSEIVLDARNKFLQQHLGRVVGLIAEAEPVREHPIYAGVFAWVARLVAEECRVVGAVPERLDYFDPEVEPEAVCCATVGGPPNEKNDDSEPPLRQM